jgi:4a-hydroxytetrahydrobiopterin dehydratase
METEHNLAHQKCVPCEGGVDPLTSEEVAKYMPLVEGWILDSDGHIAKEYSFKDFVEALAFVNAVGKIAEKEGHHPDINLHGWNKVRLTLYTHAINGLHLNDFIVAAQMNPLAKTFQG